MQKKYMINASNLHVGGGVQVAASFLAVIAERDTAVDAYVSDEVAHNLAATGAAFPQHGSWRRHNTYGLNSGEDSHREMDIYQAVFTVFGPLYRFRVPFRSIVGFAQPWIIYPRNECYAQMGPLQQLKTRLKFWLQAQFFKRADVLVVELDHVKQGLIRELGISAERIFVVHNCLAALYQRPDLWEDTDLPKVECDLRLGFLGRNYPHKNTKIFPQIAHILARQYGLNVKFYVTFTDAEWARCPDDFKAVCVNVGPLAVTQCPRFYQGLDAVVFPSLLECFSATPLEAMAMEVPLFASDRAFNRDICGDFAHYFDPLAPKTAAKAIADVFLGAGPDKKALQSARKHAIDFSSAEQRASAYMAILRQNA